MSTKLHEKFKKNGSTFCWSLGFDIPLITQVLTIIITYILLAVCPLLCPRFIDILRSAVPSQSYNDKYKVYEYSELVPTRLLQLMRTYYEEADRRITELNPMRFMYEESPHYETGYILGEIIERYKKMVELMKRPIEFKSDSVFATLKMTELIQKLYFEVYHLVNMMHEIHRKYRYVKEFMESLQPADLKEVLKRESWIKTMERQRKRRERENRKKNKKIREMELKYGFVKKTTVAKPYNRWWPIDYGWEIDYYW